MKKTFAVLFAIGLAGCQTTSPEQTFVTACSTVGEAMIQVIAARRTGKIDAATFVAIDDQYDAVVTTCDTVPTTPGATALALDRLNAFLLAASGATGNGYGSY